MFCVDKGYTPHSLCRAAAQACQGAGLSLDNIMSAGMSGSNVVKTYLQALFISSGPAALGDLLG